VTWLGRFTWFFIGFDLAVSTRRLAKAFGDNTLLMQMAAKKVAVLCALRIYFVYKMSNYFASQHLL